MTVRAAVAAPGALAAALFVYLTAELLPVGAQPELAAGLSTSPARVGLLLTAYAVVAGALTLPAVAWARRLDQRRVLVGAMVLLGIAQLGFTTAGGLGAAVGWRALAAAAHGVVWSQATVVAVRLAAPERAGRAASIVLGGSAAGLVVGAPLVAALARATDWRLPSSLVAVAALGCAVAVRRSLPPLPAEPLTRSRGRVAWRSVLVVCAVTVVVVTGHYAAYAFFVPVVGAAGLAGALVPAALAVYGLAGLAGLGGVGHRLDRTPVGTGVVVAGLLAAGVAGLGLWGWLGAPAAAPAVVAVAVWGAAAAAVPAVLNTAALQATPAGGDLASGAYVVAYQIGIATGSALGAVLLGAGPGVLTGTASALLLLGAGLVGAGRIGRRWSCPAG